MWRVQYDNRCNIPCTRDAAVGSGWKFTINTREQLESFAEAQWISINCNRETVSPETSQPLGNRLWTVSVRGRSWLTRHDFYPRRATRANEADKRRVSLAARFPEFRLSPSERIISFHLHELSQFPVDRRLLERQIPGSAITRPDVLARRSPIHLFR